MTQPLKVTVAAEIRAEIARQRRSAREVAATAGWTPMYLHRRLTEQVPFSTDDLDVLTRLLDVPLAKLMVAS